MTDLGIVSGDLVHVISADAQTDVTASDPQSVSESVSKSSTVMACSSDSEIIVKSDVTEMETDAVSQHCTEAVVNGEADGDGKIESGRTAPNVPDTELSGLRPKNVDNIADNFHERAAEAGNAGVPYAMSAEELQLVNRYLNEPMVVREATSHALPQTLVLAYSLIQPQTAEAALLIVIDVLMSELGYQRVTVGSAYFRMISK